MAIVIVDPHPCKPSSLLPLIIGQQNPPQNSGKKPERETREIVVMQQCLARPKPDARVNLDNRATGKKGGGSLRSYAPHHNRDSLVPENSIQY